MTRTLTRADIAPVAARNLAVGDIIPDGIVARVDRIWSVGAGMSVAVVLTNGNEVWSEPMRMIDVIARIDEDTLHTL